MAINIGELAATTLSLYEKSLQDNIFKDHVLLNHLKNNGGVVEKSGGVDMRFPLMHAVNSTVKTFTGTDTLDLTYQDGVDAAVYDWKNYDVSITFTLTDELKNSGESQILDLLEAKIKQAESSLAERLNEDLYNGVEANGEVLGLETMIAATGTIGEINGTTHAFWRSYVDSTGEALAIADMRTAKNSANLGAGGKKVSMIVTTQTLYEKYFSLLTASYQMNPVVGRESKRLGDAGFTAVELDGVPVAFDEQCTSTAMYFINVENYKLAAHKDANFKVIKKAEPSDQHLSVQHIVWSGNAITNRRASLSKLSGKTA